jgi:hypothetical protein
LVEAFAPNASDPALGVCPCLRRPNRRLDHPDAFGAEDLVELARELAVAVTDEKPWPGVEDDARERSFQAADRFAAALAFCLFAFEVGTGAGVVARLCDRDPAERGVELAVAAAVEPVSLYAA